MFKRLKHILNRVGSPELDWVQVEVTSHCNAKCVYCPNSLIARKRHMPLGLFKALLPYLVYTDLVYLQGWGEPLLNQSIFEMISECKKKGKRVGFTTNGMLLNDENTRKLVDLDLDIVCVSLAGTNPHTHNRIRKGTDFLKIISNIERLETLKAIKGRSKPSVHVAYLMMNSNFDEISKLVELSKSLDVKELVASNLTLIIDPVLWSEALFNIPEKYSYYIEKLEELAKAAQQSDLSFAYHRPVLEGELKSCSENVTNSCVIGVDGDVSPCVFMLPTLSQPSDIDNPKPMGHIFKEKPVALSSLSFGNIGTNSLTRIWNQKEYLLFRQFFEYDKPSIMSISAPQNCLSCYKGLVI